MSKSPALKWTVLIIVALIVAAGIAFIVAPDDLAKMVDYAPQSINGNLTIKVTDMEGNVIPGTRVAVNSGGRYKQKYCDKEGKMVTSVTKGNTRTWMRINAPGHVALFGQWGDNQHSLDNQGELLELKMEKGTEIGGQIVDLDSKPVYGAKVIANFSGVQDLGKPIYQHANNAIAQTDKNGKWKMKVIPKKIESIQFSIEHPSFLANERYIQVRRSEFDGLRNFTDIRQMEPGVSVTGTVRGPDGTPIEGAYVTPGRSPWDGRRRRALIRKTNSSGKFTFKGCEPGNSYLTVLVKGLAPLVKKIKFEKGMNPVSFRLKEGKTIKVKVVDKNKNPLAGVEVYPTQYKGIRSLNDMYKHVIKNKTDENGLVVWDGAPEEAVRFYAYKKGYITSNSLKFVAGDKVNEITMTLPLKFSGVVVDADTGKSINNFTYEYGTKYGNNRDINWQNYRRKTGAGGNFNMNIEENGSNRKFAVKVSAKGYYSSISNLFNPDVENESFEFKLKKGEGPKGVVHGLDGKPIANAIVAVYTASQRVSMNNGKLNQYDGGTQVLTDAKGEFVLEPVTEKYGVVVIHDSGVAIVDQEEFEKTKIIPLIQWATVHGKAMIGTNPASRKTMALNRYQQYRQGHPRMSSNNSTVTNDEGLFKFDKVVPGPISVSRQEKVDIEGGGTYHQYVYTEQSEVKPNENKEISFGGKGRPVIGKVIFPAGMREKLDLRYQQYTLQEQPKPVLTQSSGSNPLTNAISSLFGTVKKTAKSVPARPRQTKSYHFRLQDDNTFHIDDVVPGNYMIHLNFHYRQGVEGVQQYSQAGSISKQLTVGDIEGEVSDEPHDIGDLKILSPEEQKKQREKTRKEMMRKRKEALEKQKSQLEEKKAKKSETDKKDKPAVKEKADQKTDKAKTQKESAKKEPVKKEAVTKEPVKKETGKKEADEKAELKPDKAEKKEEAKPVKAPADSKEEKAVKAEASPEKEKLKAEVNEKAGAK